MLCMHVLVQVICCITIFRLTILFLIQDSGLARKSDHLCISRGGGGGGGEQSKSQGFLCGRPYFYCSSPLCWVRGMANSDSPTPAWKPTSQSLFTTHTHTLSLLTINSCICLPWIHPKSLRRSAFFFGCEHSKRLSSYRDREFLCVCRKRPWILRQDRTSEGTPCLPKFLLIGGAGPASTTSMAAWELLSSY